MDWQLGSDVADLRVNGYVEQAAPEPGQRGRIGGVDHQVSTLAFASMSVP
jgi:hypothetical protein